MSIESAHLSGPVKSPTMKPYSKLILICLGALALRLALTPFVRLPGIADPNHYYNLARRLATGHGFTIDYIWQFNNPPDTITHPEDYWMPLTGVVVAASMKVFGISVKAAIVPSILIGALALPLLAYWAARQMRCTETTSLFAAAAVAVLPEFVMNSLRTDTTLLSALFVDLTILVLTHGVRHGGPRPFAMVGVLSGLAYLVRSDGALLIPMVFVTLLVYARWGRPYFKGLNWRYLVLVPILAVLVALPWLVRNVRETGSLTTPKLDYMFFLTDYREHYVYSTKLSLNTLIHSQTIGQLVGKRLFEMAASVKLMYTTLDVFLPVAVVGGLILLMVSRDRDRLLILAPTLILLGGFFFFYTILVPFKSQGGSFKKTYLSLIPLLLPLAGYALERAITDRRLLSGTMLLAIGFMSANAIELSRADISSASRYLDQMRKVVAVARALPDTNGDGEIVLMDQDQFILGFLGMRSVVIPMESREVVLEVARRYRVDYLMMPPARPSLDPIYEGKETDPRFVPVKAIPGTYIVLYRFEYNP
jgi:4-amino-4-deoxy-L-arabinose transferase-like glycosyltransferase